MEIHGTTPRRTARRETLPAVPCAARRPGGYRVLRLLAWVCLVAEFFFAIRLAAQLPPAVPIPESAAALSPESIETIVARMAQARAWNREQFRPFVVTRNYRMYGKDDSKLKSEVTVSVSFHPPNRKSFSIGQSSGGIGERTVRRILQSESESAKNYAASDYSPANYNFRLLASDHPLNGTPCYLLEMTPKRQERTLLRGKIWVDARTYLVHRFEGEPAKSSSWWIKDERIVLHYSGVEGLWLLTGTEGFAKVRILGPHRLVSSDVKYEFAESDPPTRNGATQRLGSEHGAMLEAAVPTPLNPASDSPQ